METIMEQALTFIQNYNWQSPTSFLLIMVAILAVTGRWGSVLLIIVTTVLSVIAQNLIIMNIQTSQEIIGLPVVIYCIGGLTIGLIFFVSFLKVMLA